MNSWVGAAAVIGTGSLGGFAFGALMSGSCVLAISGPRRAPVRQAFEAHDGGVLAAMRDGWMAEHTTVAGAMGARRAARALATGAERVARPEKPDGEDDGIVFRDAGQRRDARDGRETARDGRETARDGREMKAAGGYRSKHRRGDPVPGSAPWEDGAHPGLLDGPLGDRTFGSPRRPPRHAAPSVSLVSRMSGLFAPRVLASGARG